MGLESRTEEIKKSGIGIFVDKCMDTIDHYYVRNIGKIAKVAGIVSTGFAGFGLGKFLYGSTPEERGSGLVMLIPSAYIAIGGLLIGQVDRMTGKVKK